MESTLRLQASSGAADKRKLLEDVSNLPQNQVSIHFDDVVSAIESCLANPAPTDVVTASLNCTRLVIQACVDERATSRCFTALCPKIAAFSQEVLGQLRRLPAPPATDTALSLLTQQRVALEYFQVFTAHAADFVKTQLRVSALVPFADGLFVVLHSALSARQICSSSGLDAVQVAASALYNESFGALQGFLKAVQPWDSVDMGRKSASDASTFLCLVCRGLAELSELGDEQRLRPFAWKVIKAFLAKYRQFLVGQVDAALICRRLCSQARSGIEDAIASVTGKTQSEGGDDGQQQQQQRLQSRLQSSVFLLQQLSAICDVCGSMYKQMYDEVMPFLLRTRWLLLLPSMAAVPAAIAAPFQQLTDRIQDVSKRLVSSASTPAALTALLGHLAVAPADISSDEVKPDPDSFGKLMFMLDCAAAVAESPSAAMLSAVVARLSSDLWEACRQSYVHLFDLQQPAHAAAVRALVRLAAAAAATATAAGGDASSSAAGAAALGELEALLVRGTLDASYLCHQVAVDAWLALVEAADAPTQRRYVTVVLEMAGWLQAAASDGCDVAWLLLPAGAASAASSAPQRLLQLLKRLVPALSEANKRFLFSILVSPHLAEPDALRLQIPSGVLLFSQLPLDLFPADILSPFYDLLIPACFAVCQLWLQEATGTAALLRSALLCLSGLFGCPVEAFDARLASHYAKVIELCTALLLRPPLLADASLTNLVISLMASRVARVSPESLVQILGTLSAILASAPHSKLPILGLVARSGIVKPNDATKARLLHSYQSLYHALFADATWSVWLETLRSCRQFLQFTVFADKFEQLVPADAHKPLVQFIQGAASAAGGHISPAAAERILHAQLRACSLGVDCGSSATGADELDRGLQLIWQGLQQLQQSKSRLTPAATAALRERLAAVSTFLLS